MIKKICLLGALLLCAAPVAAEAHCWRAPHCRLIVQEIGSVEVAPNVYVLDDLTPYPYVGPRVHRVHRWHHARRYHRTHRYHWRLSYRPMRHYEWRRVHPRKYRSR